jgi:hypothetical protein
MAPRFERLVRFQAPDGQVHYGEAGSNWEASLVGREVNVFTGSDPSDSKFSISEKKATVAKVRARASRE